MSNEIVLPEVVQPLFQPKRYKVLYGGRGSAKSWSVAQVLILIAMDRFVRVLCLREMQKSIEDSVYQLLVDQIHRMGVADKFKVTKTAISCTETGSEFTFEGLKYNINNIRSFEGADIVWVEEAHVVSKQSWEVLIPTIRKDGSEIWVTFNPELDTDETYKRFVVNTPPNCLLIEMNYRDNPFFPALLEDERRHCKQVDPDGYNTIWEGKTRQFLDGAVYASEIRQAYAEGRVTKVPYFPGKPVNTYWDLGYGDSTAIWFAQNVGFEIRVIDYYEGHGQVLDHYLRVLQERGYVYGEDWLPHDARAKTLGSRGRSIEEMMKSFGRNVRIVDNLSIADGINASRTMFPLVWFDEAKTTDGLTALKRYQYGKNAAGGYTKEPIHNAASHGSDAFRMMGVAHRRPEGDAKKKKGFYDGYDEYGSGGGSAWMAG